MRRVRDRRPSALFRGAELPRLMTLVVMLGVLALLMGRASDPATWRWLAPGAEGETSEETNAARPDRDLVAAGPIATGPTDLDREELDAAREEFQAVTDKAPLSKEEMPAYWRLVEWQEHQSASEMLRRANKAVTYNDLWHRPDKWRGQLVTMPVHLNQVIKNADLADNPLELKTIYEVYGWNSDSNPNWFMMIAPRLPAEMPETRKILEEGTFVGYFLKLQPYEDQSGKTRAMPLLIGRLIWHPAADNPLNRKDEWTWPWIAAAALAMLAAARWALYFVSGRSRARRSHAAPADSDEQSVKDWLQRAEGMQSDEPRRDESAI